MFRSCALQKSLIVNLLAVYPSSICIFLDFSVNTLLGQNKSTKQPTSWIKCGEFFWTPKWLSNFEMVNYRWAQKKQGERKKEDGVTKMVGVKKSKPPFLICNVVYPDTLNWEPAPVHWGRRRGRTLGRGRSCNAAPDNNGMCCRTQATQYSIPDQMPLSLVFQRPRTYTRLRSGTKSGKIYCLYYWK